jgi:glycerophosphoryl diester phosphodiesterase
MITLGELCELVAGRVTLVIEVKSHFDGDRRLIKRAAEVVASYRGPVALMSFDPARWPRCARSAPGLHAASSPSATIAHPRMGSPLGPRQAGAGLFHARAGDPPAIHCLFSVKDLPSALAHGGAPAWSKIAAVDLDGAHGRQRTASERPVMRTR